MSPQRKPFYFPSNWPSSHYLCLISTFSGVHKHGTDGKTALLGLTSGQTSLNDTCKHTLTQTAVGRAFVNEQRRGALWQTCVNKESLPLLTYQTTACIQSTTRQSSGEHQTAFKIQIFTQTCSLNTQSWASRFASLDTLPRDRIQINTASRLLTNASSDIRTQIRAHL